MHENLGSGLLWQEEQQRRAFRLDLINLANYFRKEHALKNIWQPFVSLPKSTMVLLRYQLRDICHLSQSQDRQLRSFALEILLQQPLLQHAQSLSSKMIAFCHPPDNIAAEPNYEDEEQHILGTSKSAISASSHVAKNLQNSDSRQNIAALQNELQADIPLSFDGIGRP